MEMPSNRERTVVRSESIGKRRSDSSLPVAVKVESLRERQRLPGGLDVSYDSKDKAAKVANPDLDFFNGLFQVDGQVAYTVILDGKNKVKAIEGADALRKRVDRLDPRAGELLRSRLAAETLKQEFEQSLAVLPDGPVKPGEPWERTEVVDGGAGLELVLRKKYEYAGTEKKGGKTLDKITAKLLEAQCRQDRRFLRAVQADQERPEGRLVRRHGPLRPRGRPGRRVAGSAGDQGEPDALGPGPGPVAPVRPDHADRRAAPASGGRRIGDAGSLRLHPHPQ